MKTLLLLFPILLLADLNVTDSNLTTVAPTETNTTKKATFTSSKFLGILDYLSKKGY